MTEHEHAGRSDYVYIFFHEILMSNGRKNVDIIGIVKDWESFRRYPPPIIGAAAEWERIESKDPNKPPEYRNRVAEDCMARLKPYKIGDLGTVEAIVLHIPAWKEWPPEP